MSVSQTRVPMTGGVWTSAIPRWLPRWGLQTFERRVLLLIGDAVAASVATVLALWLWTFTSGADFSRAYLLAQPLWLYGLVPGWVLLSFDLYDLRTAVSWPVTVRGLLTSAGIALGLYLGVFFFAPRGLLPRLAILYFIAGAFVFCLTWRRIYITVFASRYFQRRALVVGAGWAGEEIIAALAEFQPRQCAVVGLIDDDAGKHGKMVGGALVLGGQECLLSTARSLHVSEVILAISGEIQGATFQALLDCQAKGVPVVRMSSLYEQITGRVPIEHLDADWVITSFMNGTKWGRWLQLVRRAIDIVGAVVGLVCLGLIFPAAAVAIWVESRGPILYRQTRLGQGGRPFEMLKFRTMIRDAEANGQARWASADDERVTRVGRFLRRARLDEAPQFWNVLRGEMSLVGPRPERPEFIADLEKEIPFYRARLLVKPGITGWAQVNYGYSATVADTAVKLQWDLYYIKYQSLWLDLHILARTAGVVLGFKGT